MYGSSIAVWPLAICPAQTQARIDGVIERTSLLPWGAVWFELYQTSEGKLLRFPQLADFAFDPDALLSGVRATPSIDTDQASVEHLFHNNVMPMLLADRGALVLHGSAVDIGGCAIIFIGASGRGKSTLAASFASTGFPFLSDDSIRLDLTEDGYLAQPSYPSIRLWRDSDDAILLGRVSEISGVNFSEKVRYAAGGEIPHSTTPVPLRAIYVLAHEGLPATNIEPLGANEAMMEFVQHSFILDIRSASTLGGHFERMVTLANKVSAFRLDYPRNYARLPGVHSAIVSHAQSLI